ncbi:MAG: ASCH domain-containing protein [Anaeroplasmataceae bacterium]
MTYLDMWSQFLTNNQIEDVDYGVFQYDKEDLEKLMSGKIKAEISPYEVIRVNDYAIPFVGDYNIVIDDSDNAICVIKTTKVSIVPFNDIKEVDAIKLGFDGLKEFRNIYKDILTSELKEININYQDEALCVIEEFEIIYK